MAKVDLYNIKGEKSGQADLNDAVFAVQPKQEVVHQVYVAMRANARQPWADTKDRGEVSGGGRKPWKQKGTGRARHGSNRSPIWVGGGVTFGPLSARNYKQKINKKVNAQAVKMCLTDKLVEGKLIVLENYTEDAKTKTMAELRAKLPGNGRKTLMLTDKADVKLLYAVRNLPKLDLGRSIDLNVIDLLHHQYILLDKKALKALEKRLTK